MNKLAYITVNCLLRSIITARVFDLLKGGMFHKLSPRYFVVLQVPAYFNIETNFIKIAHPTIHFQ